MIGLKQIFRIIPTCEKRFKRGVWANLLNQLPPDTKQCKHHFIPLFYISLALSFIVRRLLDRYSLIYASVVQFHCCFSGQCRLGHFWLLQFQMGVCVFVLCFSWVLFFVLDIAKGLTDSLLTFLRGLNRLHTDQDIPFSWKDTIVYFI